ncbi:MAG TPA: hypothetical protein VIV12_03695 [Streptosporangiaceae bacterium]
MRTLLELAYPDTGSPITVAERQARDSKLIAAYQQLEPTASRDEYLRAVATAWLLLR